jgi:hypothetical protein
VSNNARKIFVLYHRGLRTGGPEALHQLVSTLRELGQDAYLVAHATTAGTARVAEYSVYDAPEADAIEDATGNIVVVPETFIEDVFVYKHAKKMIWWLSIDNALTFMGERLWQRTTGGLAAKIRETWVPFLRMLKHGDTPFQMRQRRDIVHLVQSSYAWSFIASRLNTVPSLLSDFTPQGEFGPADEAKRHPRLVTYNPAKGAHIIEAVKKVSDPSIEWLPIQGMTRSEVVTTLQTCAIYLDLGHHPGKDRMPREAALSGALALVVRRGSGAYFADVPIPWEHKIMPDESEVSATAAALPRLMENLFQEIRKQDAYRSAIMAERDRFRKEVSDVFINNRLGKDAYDYM